MPDYEFTAHARDMLVERSIREEWVWRTVDSPDEVLEGGDGNVPYTKVIGEYSERVLRVVVNDRVNPARIVTVYFYRRLRRTP